MHILIADDHLVVRTGLKHILLEEFQGAEIDEVSDAEALLKQIAMHSYDVVMTDISVSGRSGLDVLQEIKLHSPGTPVLILSVYPEEQYGLRVLKAGASGYLRKNFSPAELVHAVQQVSMGKKYLTEYLAERLIDAMDEDTERPVHEQLSDREFEVLKLLAAGQTIGDIAEKLSLSSSTVSTYRGRILSKMGVRSNADLTLYAMNHRLLSSL